MNGTFLMASTSSITMQSLGTCIKDEIDTIQLMRTNYVPKQSRGRADSECVSYVHM